MSIFKFTQTEDLERGYEPPKGGGATQSGLYNVTIDRAYAVKNPNTGSVMLHVEMTEVDPKNPLGGRQLFTSDLLQSGDEKGNKDHFETKDGRKVSFQGVRILKQLCDLNDGCTNINDIDWQEVQMERFGNMEKVIAAKSLTGTKAVAVFQQYEDSYSGEMKIKSKVIQFIPVGDDELEMKWKEYLEKHPIKLEKKKTTPKPSVADFEAKTNLAGW